MFSRKINCAKFPFYCYSVYITKIKVRIHSPSGPIDVVDDAITLVAYISVKDDPDAEK